MVRYFSYIDEHTIDSFYNQFDDSYDLEKKTISKGKSFTVQAKISLKNIILGFLDGEGRVMNEFTRGSSEEVERSTKIEKKIMRLLEIANGDEKSKILIDKMKNASQLICGTIQVLECNTFIKQISKIYNQEVHNYEEFLEVRNINENITWDKIINNLVFDNRFGNCVDSLEIMSNWCQLEDKLFSFVVIDNTQPIIMDMSYRKITMPHSSLRSSRVFMGLTEFSVLGILTQINNCFYLKPLALWNIVDIAVAQSYTGRKLQ